MESHHFVLTTITTLKHMCFFVYLFLNDCLAWYHSTAVNMTLTLHSGEERKDWSIFSLLNVLLAVPVIHV